GAIHGKAGGGREDAVLQVVAERLGNDAGEGLGMLRLARSVDIATEVDVDSQIRDQTDLTGERRDRLDTIPSLSRVIGFDGLLGVLPELQEVGVATQEILDQDRILGERSKGGDQAEKILLGGGMPLTGEIEADQTGR